MGCPTVKIKSDNEQGFIIINESDFYEESQTIYVPKQKSKSELKAEEKANQKLDI